MLKCNLGASNPFMNLFWQTFESSWGEILIVCNHKGLIRVTLPNASVSKELNLLSKSRETILTFKDTALIQQTKKQLDEYFRGTRQTFRLEFDIQGTDFQKRVWKELQRIPFGETRSYQDIARAINHVKAARAVGMANNKNPLPLVIPCHRVIGKNGDLVGFGGGLSLKKKMLDFEKWIATKKKPLTIVSNRRPLVHASYSVG